MGMASCGLGFAGEAGSKWKHGTSDAVSLRAESPWRGWLRLKVSLDYCLVSSEKMAVSARRPDALERHAARLYEWACIGAVPSRKRMLAKWYHGGAESADVSLEEFQAAMKKRHRVSCA